jgi:signal transduction histidine kinase
MIKKPISIKFRFMSYITFVLIGVFIIIMYTFNTVFTQYIESNATKALEYNRRFITGDDEPRQHELSNQTQLIVINDRYQIIEDRPIPNLENTDPKISIVQAIKESEVPLNSSSIEQILVNDQPVYYTVVMSDKTPGYYLIFYIQMDSLTTFQNNVSYALLVIMFIVLGLALITMNFMTNSIVKPIKAVQKFAHRIGEGDTSNEYVHYPDLEINQLNNSMNDMVNKLNAQDESQRSFFQNVSHELRTPLQIIKSQTEAAQVGLTPIDIAAQTIHNEVDNLSQLVDDILVLSRLESKSNELINSKNDLRETISSTSERYRSLANQKNIQLNFEFDSKPVYFDYNESSMEKVISNLLSNALRYAHQTITLRCLSQKDWILIEIEDDGDGILEEYIPYLFDRFYKDKTGHYGIGLSIVQSIIHSYNGHIDVKSKPGKTCFTLLLYPNYPA